MSDDPHNKRLLERRQRAAEDAPPFEKLLRGSLGERYVRCGKAGCHCRKGRGHGPVRYLTISLGVGRTQQVTVAAEDLEVVREYVNNYLGLWKVMEQISAINRELLQRRALPAGNSPSSGPGGSRARKRRSG